MSATIAVWILFTRWLGDQDDDLVKNKAEQDKYLKKDKNEVDFTIFGMMILGTFSAIVFLCVVLAFAVPDWQINILWFIFVATIISCAFNFCLSGLDIAKRLSDIY